MSELNALVVTGLELVEERNNNRINLLLTEKKYVDAGIDTVAVKRPIFDPEQSEFATKTAPWYRKAMEILGKENTCDQVEYNGKPWLIEGTIEEIKLDPHYFKDAKGNYIKDNNGDKRVAGGFKTAIFGYETVQSVTDGFRRRIDKDDFVKVETKDVEE